MTRYQVDGGAVSLFAGTVLLTRAQAEPRLGQLEGHALHRAHAKVGAKSDVRAPYAIVSEVHFKVGEVLCYDGEVPKAWASRLIDLDAAEAAQASAAADEAARLEAIARNDRESREQAELAAAMEGIQGDKDGNIGLDELQKRIQGRVNFIPTVHQLEAAWAAHVERMAR